MKERRKASEQRELWKRKCTLLMVSTLNIGAIKVKGERTGRHDGAKECRHTVPTGNKVERE